MAMWSVDLTTRAGVQSAVEMGGVACFAFAGLGLLGALVGFSMASTNVSVGIGILIGGLIECLLGIVGGVFMRKGRGFILSLLVVAVMALELVTKKGTFSMLGMAIDGVIIVYTVNGIRGLRRIRSGEAFDEDHYDVFG